jgi:hypothetical protein
MHGSPQRFPTLTTVACGIAAMAAVAQYTIQPMIPALQRPSAGHQAGQWWRLVTPLLVQTLGCYQVVANLVTLAVIGAVAERMLGRGWWLILFATGTAGGQLAAFHWHDPGGGDSIAICGLAAGITVTLLIRPEAGSVFAHWAVVCYVAALTGRGFSGARAAVLACVLAGIGMAILRRFRLPGADRIPLACCVVSAVALVALEKDLHGASLIAGMLVSTVTSRRAPRTASRGSSRSHVTAPDLHRSLRSAFRSKS